LGLHQMRDITRNSEGKRGEVQTGELLYLI
jgi:hypothetical protein